MEGLKAIVQSGEAAWVRFPGVLFAAALATGVAISWIFLGQAPATDRYFFESGRYFLLGLFGIPLFYSLTLIAERRFSGPARLAIPLLSGLAILGLYYFRLTFVSFDELSASIFYEMAALWVGLHFLAAYAPYLGFEEPRGFWEYNRGIFLRFLLSLFFSGTLWLGFGIFFAILSTIFKIDFSKGYAVTAVFILGIFNTWFFLAGVPQDWESLERDPRPYPRALKFFAQFILIPLIVLIGLGLEVLFLKDLAGARKPFDSVAPGFVFLGGFGLLAYLLLFPLDEGKRTGLRLFRVGFFLALAGPLMWLSYATIVEIRKEGLTPAFYYLFLLSLWGLGLSIYLVFARRVRIQWIPMSLSLLAAFSALPPLSASWLSRRSQEGRFTHLLSSLGLKKGSPDLKAIAGLSSEEKAKLGVKKDFFEANYGCASLAPFFGSMAQPETEPGSPCGSRTLNLALFPSLGPSSAPGETLALRLNFNLTAEGSYQGIAVQGFDFYFPEAKIQFVEADSAAETKGNPCEAASKPSLCAVFEKGESAFDLYLDREPLGRLDLHSTFEALRAKHGKSADPTKKTDTDAYFDLSPSEMSFDYTMKSHRVRLVFSHLHLNQKGERLEGGYVRFSALVRR